MHAILHPTDFALAERCLAREEAAIRTLQAEAGPRVLAYLSGAGASFDEAREVVAGLWADCLVAGVGQRPRLARYEGRCALQTWLNIVALNAWLGQKRKAASRARVLAESLDLPPSERGANGEHAHLSERKGGDEATSAWAPAAEAPLLGMLREAVEAAFAGCPAEHFVLLQLAHRDGLTVRELARIWQCSGAHVSRTLDRAAARVAEATLAHVHARDPWLDLSWSDFLELCRHAPPATFRTSAS